MGPDLDLHHAVAEINPGLVRQLLAEGADPCAHDNKVGIVIMGC